MASVNIADDEKRIVQEVGCALIRTLNDQFRKTGIGGSIFAQEAGYALTRGVEYLPENAKQKIIEAVRAFDDFSDNNDPYGEHDCAAIKIDGNRIFWKIDYYDRQLKNLSPDASNTDLTNRVMSAPPASCTIMLSGEY